MIGRRLAYAALGLVGLLAITACQTPNAAQAVTPSAKGAVELRAMQGRMFETSDRGKTIRTVIATLQDLGYSIEKVEAGAGTVTARKLAALEMTVTVFPRGSKYMTVRANAVVTTSPSSAAQVDAPEFYQTRFFEPLSKALFLSAHADTGNETPATTPGTGNIPPAVKPPSHVPAPKSSPKDAPTKS